jgi:hypothetical protein
VVAPGFLANPEVRQWLGGVEPAWTALAFDSYNALRQEPSADNRTLLLEPSLTPAELVGSAVVRAARALLSRAADRAGLKLTATGNLSRAVVAEMLEIIEWPGLDKAEMLRYHKVINEPDFLALHFVRILLQSVRLLRKEREKMLITRLGRRVLTLEQHGALQAILFHIAFWHVNLAYFDGDPIPSWPQDDAGIVLWSLSATADDWRDREALTRLCAVPVIGVLETPWDRGWFAMEARILRPLTWFGLIESRLETGSGPMEQHLYRKTFLFDRFLRFNVQIEGPTTRH